MTPEQAAESRRRKKEQLERQLAALNEEDRYYASASQPPDLPRVRDHTYPSSSSQPSRSGVISPLWPETAVPTGSNDWRSVPSSSGPSRNRTASSAFQTLPDPTPMDTGSNSATSAQAPWSRAGVTSSSSSARLNEMYTPSPDLQSLPPRMPNPFSASFINIAVPSKEQVNTYLVRAQNLPHGLRTGWTISSHAFDVYNLFVAVVRLGGTNAVSRRQWWPELAETLGIPGVNSPQGRNIVESGRQLYTFFTTQLGPLEDMWEQTSGNSETAGLIYALTSDTASQPQVPRVRQPISATRGGLEDDLSHSWTRTYPPQPPPPLSTQNKEASSTRSSGPSRQRQSTGQASSSTMPLHVNPAHISTRRTTDHTRAATQQSGSQDLNSQRYPYANLSQTAVPSSRPSQPNAQSHAQAPSVSPALHHPIPGSLGQGQLHSDNLDQYASGNTSADTTPNMPAALLPTSSTRSQPAAAAAVSTSTAGQHASSTNGKSKPFTFPPLINYNPPKFASFDHLVQTNALTLPKLPPDVQLDYVGTPTEVYAKRCFELRSVVKKIQGKEPARLISVDEMTFWEKLLAILRHNPEVIIPGHQPMSTENAPIVPTQSAANHILGQTSTSASEIEQTSDQIIKKKRSRSRKDPVEGAEGSQPKKRGRPRKEFLDGDDSQPKKKGRPRKERIVDNAPAEPSFTAAGPSTQPPADAAAAATSIDPRLQVLEAEQMPFNATPEFEDSRNDVSNSQIPANSQAVAEADATLSANDDIQSSQPKKNRKTWTARVNPDGTPVARKPYTVRLNQDGTPVSDRFKKRVSSGNLGRVTYITPPAEGPDTVSGPLTSQPTNRAPSAATQVAGPSAPLQQVLGEADAEGEIDHSVLPQSLQQAIENAKRAQAELSRILAATQPARGAPPVSAVDTARNPARIEGARQAALRHWERVRQEREALGMPTDPMGVPRKQPTASPALPSASPSTAAANVTGTSAAPARPSPSARPVGIPTPANQTTQQPAARGGFSVPGAAQHAAQKRWSLHQANAYANGSGRQSTTADLAYINAVRAGSVKPFAGSPQKRISLSGQQPTPGISSQDSTPVRLSHTHSRERAESVRPRSSLPLSLTPAPRRTFARLDSEPDDHEDLVDIAGPPDDLDDDDYEMDDAKHDPGSRITRGAASRARDSPAINTRSRPKARTSLPARLSRPPISTRSDKGKGVERRAPDVEPSPRSILTRNARASGSFPSSSQPPIATDSPLARFTRASSTRSSRPKRSRNVVDLAASISRPRRSLPSTASQPPPLSSQGRPRRVPEVEVIVPSKAASLSPVKLNPRPRPRQTADVKPRIVAKPSFKPKLKAKAVPKSKSGLKASRPLIQIPRVVLRINARRRQGLIDCDAYNIFNDDDSDDEEVLDRGGYAGLRKIALPRGSLGRTARPTAPEAIPIRFFHRGGPALLEPFKTVLDESTILKRAVLHECQWKGCDSLLASEWHLRRHFELKRHSEQGSFKAGTYGEKTLYRCHWVECEKPCFSSLDDLEQHLTARHISRTLACPWSDCDLRFLTMSHLTRHAVKHHDEPEDRPRPLADTIDRSVAPRSTDQPLPATIKADTLITRNIRGSTYSSVYRREWCKLKVRKGSLAPPDPSLVARRRPHILEAVGEDAEDDEISDTESLYTTLAGGAVIEERLLDESTGRNKRRLFPVVDIRIRKVADAGWYQDPKAVKVAGDEDAPIDIDDFVGDHSPEQPSPKRRTRFDLSDSEHDDETRGSESEVWAELEDLAAETAFTPAGFPADFDTDGLEEEAEQAGPSHPQDEEEEDGFDALVNGTFSTPAAYLGLDIDDEELEAGLQGERSGSVQQVEEPMDLDDLPIWDGQLATMPEGLLGSIGVGDDVEPAEADQTIDETMEVDVDAPAEPEVVDDPAPPASPSPTGEAQITRKIAASVTVVSETVDRAEEMPAPVDAAVATDEGRMEPLVTPQGADDATVSEFSGLSGKSPPLGATESQNEVVSSIVAAPTTPVEASGTAIIPEEVSMSAGESEQPVISVMGQSSEFLPTETPAETALPEMTAESETLGTNIDVAPQPSSDNATASGRERPIDWASEAIRSTIYSEFGPIDYAESTIISVSQGPEDTTNYSGLIGRTTIPETVMVGPGGLDGNSSTAEPRDATPEEGVDQEVPPSSQAAVNDALRGRGGHRGRKV